MGEERREVVICEEGDDRGETRVSFSFLGEGGVKLRASRWVVESSS